MLSERQYKAQVFNLSTEPRPGMMLPYKWQVRSEEEDWEGMVLGVVTMIPRGCKEVVYAYVVDTHGKSNLSAHVVHESFVDWEKFEAEQCPRCNGWQVLGIRNGDDDLPCSCQEWDDELPY